MAAGMKKRADGRYQLKVTTPDGPRIVYGRTRADVRGKAEEMRTRIRLGRQCAMPAARSLRGSRSGRRHTSVFLIVLNRRR